MSAGEAARRIGLYLVTDTAQCGGADGVVATAVAAAEQGVDMVQLRDHGASTRELSALATRLIDALDGSGVPLVVDDRLDIALAVGAGGVHLGQSDLDPVAARRLADAAGVPGFHIGCSVSTGEQVLAAGRLPRGTVDLLGIGPYRATPTKPDAAQPLGLDGVSRLADAAWSIGQPNVVIGGVKRDDVAPLVAAGAQGVAVVSAICAHPDPALATRELRRALDEAYAAETDDRPARGGSHD